MNKFLKKFVPAIVVASLIISAPSVTSATTFPVPTYVEQVGASQAGLYTVESVGQHLWAATISTRKVVKIAKSTGLVVATYDLPSGATGNILKSSVDSTYLWLSHAGSAGVSRVKLSDGTSDYFSTGLANNNDIVSDGEFVWVTASAANKVFKLDAATGAKISEVTLTGPQNIDSDGLNVWVTYQNGTKMAKLNRADGTVIMQDVNTGIGSPSSNSSDLKIYQGSVFISTNGGPSIFERSVVDGAAISAIPNISSVNVAALVIYGETLWVLNSGATSSAQFDLRTRSAGAPTLVGSFTHGTGSGKVNGVYDGTHLYATDTGATIRKYSAQSYEVGGQEDNEPENEPQEGATTSPTTTAVIDVNPTNITVDNEIITILGANLNTVTEVYIGGVKVPIFTQSGNRLQVRAPKGLSGLVDLELKSSLNDVLMTKKLNFGGTAAVGTRKATLIVGGFAHNSRKLTARMQARIDRWLERNSDLSTLTCTGFTSLPRRTTDVTLSTNRGKTACNFSKQQRSELKTSVSQGIEDPRPGSNVRRVRLVLTP